jgi:septal ring factor EnvC (AmiA/AmiB activator)
VLLACLRDNAAPAAADLTGIGMDLTSVPVVSGPQPVTLANLPAAELRVRYVPSRIFKHRRSGADMCIPNNILFRLRTSELECARHRNKGLALQQKVKELEAELKTAEESVAKLSKQRERVDDLLRTIARKDSTIQVLEAQIEKLKLKLDDLDMNARVERVEFNKKEM